MWHLLQQDFVPTCWKRVGLAVRTLVSPNRSVLIEAGEGGELSWSQSAGESKILRRQAVGANCVAIKSMGSGSRLGTNPGSATH